MFSFGKEFLDYKNGIKKEWIIANGIGGYASSTIIGVNTRKYHGLLIASLDNPVRRFLLLSKLEEEITIGNKTYLLSTNKYKEIVYPHGFIHQKEFLWDVFPCFIYEVENLKIIKKIFMLNGYNAVIVTYDIKTDNENITNNKNKKIKIKIRPLINFRSIHDLNSCPEFFDKIDTYEKYITVDFKKFENLKFSIGSDLMKVNLKKFYINNITYDKEEERGYNSIENLFCPCEFVSEIDENSNNKINIIGVCDKNLEIFKKFYSESNVYEEYYKKERKKIEEILNNAKIKPCKKMNEIYELIRSADNFIVKRDNGKSIIAGYHWFSDFGRDTMISLPGLLLVTRRFDDARQILTNYAKNIYRGLIPNRFSENNEPEYNSVDASLWFIYAIYKFLEYTNDYSFVKQNLWKSIKDIINFYIKGTCFNIYLDDDFLICHGRNFNKALTWMDVNLQVNNSIIIPTKRNGKAVEINALFFNALKIAELLSEKFSEDATYYRKLSEKVKENFKKFFNEKKQCLYDTIYEDYKDDSIRPNQIFGVSLPFSIIEREKEKKIVEKVYQELYTPYGLRTLSYKDKRYKNIYKGCQIERDIAYHQGTVWPWLMGFFIDAYLKVNDNSIEARREAKNWIEKIFESMKERGIGTISEIFDGDFPHNPKGCISQAWSVGEILRCYIENKLYEE